MPSVFFLSLMNSAAWGGSEELWYQTALLALQKKWRVGCAVYNWPGKENKLQSLKESGAIIYRLPNKGVRQKNLLEKILFKVTKKTLLKRYITLLPFHQYDVIVISLGEFENTHTAWASLYKKLDCYIVLYHNYAESQVLKAKKAKTLQFWIDNSKANLFASRRIKEVLQKNSCITVKNDAVLLNPITFNPAAQPALYPSLMNGNYIFVMLAALDVYRKAQDNLIKGLSSKKWKERNWQLHLYGAGKDLVLLKNLIISKGMEKKIFLKGHTNNVQQILQGAHLLLQMTHIDAMPLAVVEAMAMGRPIVVSNVGDMPYWIHENENGWISENASPEAIDITLEKAWGNRENWELFGKKAFESFKRKFSISPEEDLLKKINLIHNKTPAPIY